MAVQLDMFKEEVVHVLMTMPTEHADQLIEACKDGKLYDCKVEKVKEAEYGVFVCCGGDDAPQS